jgi:hypothetical protein
VSHLLRRYAKKADKPSSGKGLDLTAPPPQPQLAASSAAEEKPTDKWLEKYPPPLFF